MPLHLRIPLVLSILLVAVQALGTIAATGARRHLERELRRHSDSRRRLVGLAFLLPLFGGGAVLVGLLEGASDYALLGAVGLLAAVVGLLHQLVDAHETRRVGSRA